MTPPEDAAVGDAIRHAFSEADVERAAMATAKELTRQLNLPPPSRHRARGFDAEALARAALSALGTVEAVGESHDG